ncbi:hypothetical protein [Colwellia sp. RSH04]|uniref:hypothetical protein n=1 Tax=Colwellia sp. RSH04 TaxID=2305464 RepID=UPI000E56F841|nr:hypothetical protein [Colwellia sp. RSH04]RHW76680.1 hypothetical protein D1094_06240 [Colwellia sp. RSH04]
MQVENKDLGVITVLLKRFEHERLPKAKALKAKVDEGNMLDDADLSYLEQVLTDSHQVMGLLNKHPEYAALAKETIKLYEDIMTTSQRNSNL